jgi:hypothetical protein
MVILEEVGSCREAGGVVTFHRGCGDFELPFRDECD